MTRKKKAEDAEHGVRLERWPLEELLAAKVNPKRHARGAIQASVERFGYVEPIIVDERTRRIVSGHGRFETLYEMRQAGQPAPAGIEVKGATWLVPVILWRSRSDAEAEAFLLAVNRTVEAGGWDRKGLDAVLRDLMTAGSDLATLGFSRAELESALAGAGEALATAARGATERGRTPEELADGFETSAIRQVVLVLSPDEYDDALTRFEEQRKRLGLETNGEVVLALLRESAS